MASRARALKQQGMPSGNADLQKAIQRLLPVASRTGDAKRGEKLFETTCAVCHVVNGKGGRIGPDLTGIGLRPRQDILVDILDPNRSVEANYRLWTATTKGGETVAGRLESESATSIEILDTTGMKHAIQRKDIAALEASGQSIMPSGFEQLPAEDLAEIGRAHV